MNEDARELRRVSATAYGAALVSAIAGGLATQIGPWYYALRKPSYQPPDWLFGPVWTLIYGLTALAAILAWRAARSRAERRWMLALFAANIGLNLGWSVLFFTLRRPDFALAEVALLWLSVLALVIHCGRLHRTSGLLLLPYLAWVSFASFLNHGIVQLNAPFGVP